ncbi:MAG: transcriptional regulator [Bacillaceae bacterium G1]|nr:transcriptional regulator [Bacillota bacterium]OJF17677.1 MAG: transcriptional regulator [Bacillaceae bacterium G1]
MNAKDAHHKKTAQSGNELLRLFEALANPHRLKIIAALTQGRKYVSQLAREVNMSRPLLYMHLQKMEEAGLVTSSLELSEDGKAMKYYAIVPFDIQITPEVIAGAIPTLTATKKSNTLEEDSQ